MSHRARPRSPAGVGEGPLFIKCHAGENVRMRNMGICGDQKAEGINYKEIQERIIRHLK